jgi:hypothetical protein
LEGDGAAEGEEMEVEAGDGQAIDAIQREGVEV